MPKFNKANCKCSAYRQCRYTHEGFAYVVADTATFDILSCLNRDMENYINSCGRSGAFPIVEWLLPGKTADPTLSSLQSAVFHFTITDVPPSIRKKVKIAACYPLIYIVSYYLNKRLKLLAINRIRTKNLMHYMHILASISLSIFLLALVIIYITTFQIKK